MWRNIEQRDCPVYTRCPKCKTVFEASPEDLDAHEGLVRCGECDEVFHVLDNQIDQEEITLGGSFADSINRILDESEALEESSSSKTVHDETSGDRLEEIELKQVATPQPDPEIYKRRLNRDENGYPTLDESEIDRPSEQLSPAPVTAGFTDSTANAPEFKEIQPELNLDGAAATGPASKAKKAAKTGKTARFSLGWGVGLASLLALAAIQSSVHIDGIRTNPALRPTLESICGVFGCTGVLQKDNQLVSIIGSNKIDSAPGEFTLTSRIKNNAAFEERLPDLEVTLTNSFQMMIGRRTFTPEQYLADKSLVAKGTIAPGQEIEARLPLVSDGLQVAGYELHLRNPE